METIEQIEKESTKDERVTMVFNEFCADGVFRPVWICPSLVTSIKELVGVPDPNKIGTAYASTLITWKEPDTFLGFGKTHDIPVYEPFSIVLAALGTSMAAISLYSYNFYYAGRDFEKRGFSYCVDSERPATANELP